MNIQAIDREIISEAFISDEALRNLELLCDRFCHRFAGTPNERRARRFLVRKLREYGLTSVTEQPVSFKLWHRGRSPRLKLLSPRKLSLHSLSLPYCPSSRVEAELADLGMGLPEDFQKKKQTIRGKVVLVTNQSPPWFPRWVHRAEKYARSVSAGAVAFLFANFLPGMLPETGCLRFNREGEIPGLSVSKETCELIRRLNKDGKVQVSIETFDSTTGGRSANLIATLPGNTEECIMICAHFDGHDIAPSGADNASGTAVILETARILSRYYGAFRRTILFCLFTAEEVGLVGAYTFVRRSPSLLRKIRLAINVDGIGSERAKGFNFQAWSEAEALVLHLSKEMKWEMEFASRINPYSDHFPFVLKGIPSASFGNFNKPPSGRGFGHTFADTPDKVSLFDLREASCTLSRVLLRLATMDEIPLKPKTRSEIRRKLEEHGVLPALRAEGCSP